LAYVKTDFYNHWLALSDK